MPLTYEEVLAWATDYARKLRSDLNDDQMFEAALLSLRSDLIEDQKPKCVGVKREIYELDGDGAGDE